MDFTYTLMFTDNYKVRFELKGRFMQCGWCALNVETLERSQLITERGNRVVVNGSSVFFNPNMVAKNAVNRSLWTWACKK